MGICYNAKYIPSMWITKRIFHNVVANLENHLDLPNDIIGIIKNMDLSLSGLDYVCEPAIPEVWPLKVQHGFTKKPLYRVVFQEVEEDTWTDLPDVL